MNQTMTNCTPAENGTILCGWFLKEKRDHFSRRNSLVSSNNRRWFQIERVHSELALCYYRRQPKQDDQATGFFFLSDIISLSQDAEKKLITLEHPSRILRLQSPSLAQHTHSYSALVRSCPNASSLVEIVRDSSSPSLLGGAHQELTSATSTSKDESKFLREEITGDNNIAASVSSSESGIQDTSASSTESENDKLVTLERDEEEKTTVEPLYYRGDGKQDDRSGKTCNMEQLRAVLYDDLMATHVTCANDIPKSNSFSSHQIQRSSSYRLHFGDDEIQPDDNFLHDDWDA
jgi:hypothetical protein